MKATTHKVSPQTRNNWLLDAALFTSSLLAMLSGVYFLYFPSGGYAGGRNPAYNLVLLFERHTWEDLHTWGGLVMILVASLHLVWHWSWVMTMTRRAWNIFSGGCGCMNARARWNLILNALVAVSFLVTGVSGLYLFFVPGGRGALAATTLFFSRTTWDLIHTWSGVGLALLAILHFAIHWKWVTKVTRKILQPFVNIRLQAKPGSAASE